MVAPVFFTTELIKNILNQYNGIFCFCDVKILVLNSVQLGYNATNPQYI